MIRAEALENLATMYELFSRVDGLPVLMNSFKSYLQVTPSMILWRRID